MLEEFGVFLDGRLGVLLGDITGYGGDAIANAANSSLQGGGGVDGAIHRAAGPELLEECLRLRAGALKAGLPAGAAVKTKAGRLACRYVIHTVGPVWNGGLSGEPETLASCYRSLLCIARDEGLGSIAIPAISTGVYGYPKEAALRLAIKECREFLADNAMPKRIDLVFYSLSEAAEAKRLLE